MSINNRLINAGGGAPQPEGTGSLLWGSSNGFYISVDDGLTWTQDGIVGLPNNNNFVTRSTDWNGTVFCTSVGGTNESFIYTSPDGYNWTQTATIARQDDSGMAVDPVTRAFIYAAGIYASGYGIFESLDNGVTWTPKGSGGAYYTFSKVAQRNGYGVASGRTGNWLRTAQANNYGNQTTYTYYNSSVYYQNNSWVANRYGGYDGVARTTGTSPGRFLTWPQVQSAANYVHGAYNIFGNGVSEMVTTWYTGQNSGQYNFITSTDNGASWSKTTVAVPLIPYEYHNGKFIVRWDSGATQRIYSWTPATGLVFIANAPVNFRIMASNKRAFSAN